MSHFVKNRGDRAWVERSTCASDLLWAADAANARFALRAVIIRIKVEVDVIGFRGAGDKFDVGESIIELGDGGIEIGEVAASGGDDVRNLVLITNLGPPVLCVGDADGINVGGVDLGGRQLVLGVDGVDFLEDDVSLENSFAVLDDVGHGHASIKAVHRLFDRRGCAFDRYEIRLLCRLGAEVCYRTRWTCGETEQREEHPT